MSNGVVDPIACQYRKSISVSVTVIVADTLAVEGEGHLTGKDSRPPLIMVCGLQKTAVHRLSQCLLPAMAGTVRIHHDLSDVAKGMVLRRIDFYDGDAIRHDEQILELAHGCISSTLREDVLPLLRALARRRETRRLILQLDPSLEPDTVSWCSHNEIVDENDTVSDFVRIEAVIAVLQAASWLVDAAGDVPLRDIGLAAAAQDERNLAQIVIGHAEMADLIVLAGDAGEPWAQVRTHATLDRLAPGVPRIRISDNVHLDAQALLERIPSSGRHAMPSGPYDHLLRGKPPLDSDCGIALTLFSDARPFHPERFHHALKALIPGTVRMRGRMWLASRPEATIWLETNGGAARVGQVGTWLATRGDDWHDVDPERAAMAAAVWHPRFGDRRQEIVVLSHDLPAAEITETLTAALLTNEELAAEELWPDLRDPFAEDHIEPGEEFDDSSTRPDRRDQQ